VWLRLKVALGDLLVEGQYGCVQFYHRQLKEVAESYFGGDKVVVCSHMAKYFGNLIDTEILHDRHITSNEWTMNGVTPFHVKSVVNIRRCHEAVSAMLGCDMSHRRAVLHDWDLLQVASWRGVSSRD
jgi:hypothetical protein